MLSLEEYSEAGTEPLNARPEALLGRPVSPGRGCPGPLCMAAAQEHGGGVKESQRQSLLFSLKTITSRTRTGDV